MEKEFNFILFFMIEFISEAPLNPEIFGRNVDMENSAFFFHLCHFICKSTMK